MPALDINIFPTYNKKTFAVGDNSYYESNLTIVSPTLQVTLPGYSKRSVDFTPSSLNIYNSNTLGLTSNATTEELLILPDGIWILKYSINPSAENNISVTILKTDLLEEKFDSAFLALDVSECDNAIYSEKLKILDDIKVFIQSAKATARACNNTLSVKLYRLADEKLNKFIKTNCYGMSNC